MRSARRCPRPEWPALSDPLRVTVALRAGRVELGAAVYRPDEADAAIVLAHGAGSRHDHPSTVAVADALATRGIASLRFDFPYVAVGRRMPGPAADAVAAWKAVLAEAARVFDGLSVFAGGRSYGGRMATTADAEGAIAPRGIVAIAYPLHPPGKPEQLRVAHLPAVSAPLLVVSGTTDPFVQPRDALEAAVASCRDGELRWVEGVGHSFDVERSVSTGGEPAASVIAEWIRVRA